MDGADERCMSMVNVASLTSIPCPEGMSCSRSVWGMYASVQ